MGYAGSPSMHHGIIVTEWIIVHCARIWEIPPCCKRTKSMPKNSKNKQIEGILPGLKLIAQRVSTWSGVWHYIV